MNKIAIPAEQGDVTLIQASIDVEILKGKKRRRAEGGRVILARGETTGHHHSLSAGNSYVVEADGQLQALFNAQVGAPEKGNLLSGVLVVKRPDPFEHTEHAAIEIAPGIHWVVIEQEYSPAEIRRAID